MTSSRESFGRILLFSILLYDLILDYKLKYLYNKEIKKNQDTTVLHAEVHGSCSKEESESQITNQTSVF